MAVGSLIVLRNTSNNKVYSISAIESISSSKEANVMVMPFPEGEGDENIITKLSGAERHILFSFTIVDSSTDLSNGDTIKTSREQINYLETYFISGKITYGCEIYLGTDALSTITADVYADIVEGTDCLFKFKGQLSNGSWRTQGGLTHYSYSVSFSEGQTY